jgi:hypothetical protein
MLIRKVSKFVINYSTTVAYSDFQPTQTPCLRTCFEGQAETQFVLYILQKMRRPIEKNIGETACSNQHCLQLEFGVVAIINF